MRRLIVILAIAGPLLVPVGVAAHALATAGCPLGQSPRLAAEFAALKEQLGAAMGEPLDCMRAEGPGGDLVQPTTAGFAYRHADGAPTFTTGREFWALTAAGLERWAGSPHLGFARPGADPAPATDPSAVRMPPPSTYPVVEAVSVVRAADLSGGGLVVRRGERLHRLALDPGCAAALPPPGQAIFIRSPGAFAGEGAELVRPGQGGACRILGSSEP